MGSTFFAVAGGVSKHCSSLPILSGIVNVG